MHTEIQIIITPEEAAKDELLRVKIAEKLELDQNRISAYKIKRRSIDARTSPPRINLALDVYLDGTEVPEEKIEMKFQDVSEKPAVIVVGAGPAGLFASMRLLELSVKPILIERGKSVRERKLDIAQLNRNMGFNKNSNYSFGEGGAGAFSDGKLHTRSKKKGNVKRVYEKFYYHMQLSDEQQTAEKEEKNKYKLVQDESILYDSQPHVGLDRLPLIVENMRTNIIKYGGEVHFEERVTELIIEDDVLKGCKTDKGNEYYADALILATGNSTHDLFESLHEQGVELEPKGFSMGVRVEHKQDQINSIQYKVKEKGDYLPAATYSLVAQIEERAVYSFCMCPGGHMIPAGTNPESIVINGVSTSKRNSDYSSSGIVVEVRPEDIPEEFEKYGPLKALRYQQHVENLAFRNNGGKGLAAPAQRLKDFVDGVLSVDLPENSYLPGTISSPLHFWLPESISSRLREAFIEFNKKMPGFLTNDALVLAVESRSSSPVRILRDRETMQHIRIKGLYPAGEGSGYSGGITSSAIDGENAAAKAAEYILSEKINSSS